MTIKGRILKILDVEKGTSKAGKDWKKQNIVIQNFDDKFNQELCITLFGEYMDLLNGNNVNDVVEIDLSLRSREYNGKYYHDISAVGMIGITNHEENPF